MPEEDTIGRIIKRDLDRLPMLPADRWIPTQSQRNGRRWRVWPTSAVGVARTVSIALAVAVVAGTAGLGLAEWRAHRLADEPQTAASPGPSLPIGQTTASPSSIVPLPPAFDVIVPSNRPLPPIRELAATDATARQLWAITSAQSAELRRSDDGGSTWTTVSWLGGGSGPAHVAAAGTLVLVSDLGMNTASNGVSATGGLYLSKDRGASWKRVATDAVGLLMATPFRGGTLFLAEHPWVSKGAATGQSRIFASTDGENWQQIGEVPGPARFGMLDVPLVSFGKNVPGDGLFRVDGSDLASLRLVAVPGSTQSEGLLRGSGSELWSFNPGNVVDPRVSDDGGRTWRTAGTGLAGRIAGLFLSSGVMYAIGDGAFRWDGTRWQMANILIGKAAAVFPIGDHIFVQDLPGGLWRSSAQPPALTRDAIIRRFSQINSEIRRIDRIDAKLMSRGEFERGSNNSGTSTSPITDPDQVVWVVAISGEVVPQFGRGSVFMWGIYLVTADNGEILGMLAGGGSWPPYFAGLPTVPGRASATPPVAARPGCGRVETWDIQVCPVGAPACPEVALLGAGSLEVCPSGAPIGTQKVALQGTNCGYPGSVAIIYFGSANPNTFGSVELGRFQPDASGSFHATFTVPAQLNPIQGSGGGPVVPGKYRIYSKPEAFCEVPFEVTG